MSDAQIDGSWAGEMEYCGVSQSFRLRVDEDTEHAAWIDLPAVGMLDIPIEAFDYDAPDVAFDLPLERGRVDGTAYDNRIVGTTGTEYLSDFEVTVTLERSAPPTRPYREEQFSFTNGEVRLEGTVTIPEGSGPHPAIVIAHGAAYGERDFPVYRFHADRFAKAGIVTLSYDRRGAGTSTGDFEHSDFGDLAEDLIAGATALADRDDTDPGRIGVWGISQGGWVGPEAASRSDKLSFCVVASGTAVSPARQMYYYTEHLLRRHGFGADAIEEAIDARQLRDKYYRGTLSEDEFASATEAVEDEPWSSLVPTDVPDDPAATKWYHEFDYDPVPAYEDVTQPTLVVYGGADTEIPTEESIPIWESSLKADNDSVRICELPRADHLLTVMPSSDDPWHWRHLSPEYTNTLFEWFEEYGVIDK